jgi:hypothetical protein
MVSQPLKGTTQAPGLGPSLSGNVLFYGDSILHFAASDYCAVTKLELWNSIGGLYITPHGGPTVCNTTDSRLLMEFMQFGFGYDLPNTHERHPLLPPSSMESLVVIHKKIGISGLNNTVDVFCLESNLWEIQHYKDFFLPDYTNEWKKNATKMFQLVEHLFPKATFVWISTCISNRGTARKPHAEYLNIAA